MSRHFLAALLLPSLALAQPMIDPAQMSGIPRPDPSVPVGTLTVRVLRGDFAHPLIGQEVTLDGPGGPRAAKTDDTDHAVFQGLTTGRGAYVVKSSAFGEDLASQPIEMPPSSGVKIMLVFHRDEKALLGEPDGVARPDPRLPRGTLEIKLVDGDDHPVAGVEVTMAHARKPGEGEAAAATPPGAPKVEERRRTTDASGRARYDGQETTGADGYMVVVKTRLGGADAQVNSKPFRLDGESGSLLALRLLPVTRDASAISIGRKSHLLVEVKDDEVEVVENLVLENTGSAPFDPGPGGLHFPIPDGGEGLQLGPEPPAQLTAAGREVVWKGQLPTGETSISFGLTIPSVEHRVELRQRVPIALAELAMITSRFDGMSVDGDHLDKVERAMGGRSFWVIRGPGVKAGESFTVRLDNLPHRPTWIRDLVVALSALVAAWGLLASLRARAAPDARRKRAHSEKQRDQLLDELAALDRTAAETPAKDAPDDPKLGRRRDELYAQLQRIYRELDGAE